MGEAILRMVCALSVVLAIAFVAVPYVKRFRGVLGFTSGRSKALHVLEKTSLSQHHAVYVIGHESRRYLIGAGTHGLTLLAEIPKEKVKRESVRAGV